MKILKMRTSQLLLITALIMPWTTLQAAGEFTKVGTISKVRYQSFYVDGRLYRLSKGAKIAVPGKSNAKLKDLPIGTEEVQFGGKKRNGINYVDWVFVYVPH